MKNKILSIMFCLFIFGFGIASVLIPDKEISVSERRMLTTLPKINLENLLNGEITNKFEDYALDHFAFRDSFRSIKSFAELNMFMKNDYNNYYVASGYIFKMISKDVENLNLFASKINKIYDKYLKDMKVYYSLIPEKNHYYVDNHLNVDYVELSSLLKKNINENITFIDIEDNLSLVNYYYTDIHWRQETLNNVVEKLASYMNFDYASHYKTKEYKPFYGSYYGSLSIGAKTDTLVYLENDFTKNAIVKDYDSNLDTVYEISSLGKVDSYDVFLGGATPLIEIDNTMLDTGKELIIFRDSFGSSLAPLLLPGYKKITLVDLRYMSADLLDDYIDFNEQDVLFLYNMELVLNSNVLKV